MDFEDIMTSLLQRDGGESQIIIGGAATKFLFLEAVCLQHATGYDYMVTYAMQRAIVAQSFC